jgi:hypothetical protein
MDASEETTRFRSVPKFAQKIISRLFTLPSISHRVSSRLSRTFSTGLVQVSFCDSVHPPPLMPRWATALNFVIPTGADADFLYRKSGVA